MTASLYHQQQANSYLSDGNAAYLEDLYEAYLQDPNQVAPEWQAYFAKLPQVADALSDISHAAIRATFKQAAHRPAAMAVTASADIKQGQVNHLIDLYRRYGHYAANIDPLGFPRAAVPELALSFVGLSEADLKSTFTAPDFFGTEKASLGNIQAILRQTYCGTIATQYKHMRNHIEVNWVRERIEAIRGKPVLTPEQQAQILAKLVAADGLERYLASRYVGQKRFSLEGGDALIPLLDEICQQAGSHNLKEMVIGMAHRGRLNVLMNIMGKPAGELFDEFEGKADFGLTSGDVKYHFGFSSDVITPGGQLHLSLASNPSHLEIVSPVVMGSVRARQDHHQDETRAEVMGILVHGDAAFAGQGVIMESLNMAHTRAYEVGGTIHIIVNNQVGFTTSNPKDARSSTYCTDIAKMIDIPVFHVNADDPEAVAFLAKLAVDYRNEFHKDVIIDLVCYRRHGHNEADEPSATQPLMYQRVNAHPRPYQLYAERLINEKVLTQTDVDTQVANYRDKLESRQAVVKTEAEGLAQVHAEKWEPFLPMTWEAPHDTRHKKTRFIKLAKQLTTLPEGFTLQRQVGHLIEARHQMTLGKKPLDWGYAETMAYATLLDEGYDIRFSGQDVRRGTFAHRHAALFDQKTDQSYIPLTQLNTKGHFQIYDSLLSEEGVLAFEYGYAKTAPNSLVIWEAQFGDFANGAQVVIDQFVSSSWQKWRRLCGMVLLLPHGQEGMGPEHSSARLERYLQLTAQNNIQVCVPSTPAQIFHLLRRQMHRPFRHPLIIMSPKSLLRHKMAVSSIAELTDGGFQLVIPETDTLTATKVNRIVLCSGKIYYELLTKRRELKLKNVAIIRIEQLYPFPYDALKKELAKYKNATDIIWCQEEPRNQGAWHTRRHSLERCIKPKQTLDFAGTHATASPAPGYPALHLKQQAETVAEALGI